MGRMSRVAALLVALISLAGAMTASAGQGRQGSSPDDRGSLIDRRGSDEDDDRDEPRKPLVSLDAAVSIVRSRYDGKVIRAETHGSDDHPMHQIRVLSPDGRVYTVTVD